MLHRQATEVFSPDRTNSLRARAGPGDSQRVQLVHRLVLVGPLEVHLDLAHQRQAEGMGDVQLLRLVDAVFLTSTQSHHTLGLLDYGKKSLSRLFWSILKSRLFLTIIFEFENTQKKQHKMLK